MKRRITDGQAHASLRRNSAERAEKRLAIATAATAKLLELTSDASGMTTIERLEILHICSWLVFSLGAKFRSATPERDEFFQAAALVTSMVDLPDTEIIAGFFKVVGGEQAN